MEQEDQGKSQGRLAGHYDEDYFIWQRTVGAFGGAANLFKFERFIENTDNVLEFGCGGGFLLDLIKCREKVGVEINPTARAATIEKGIPCYESADEIGDGWADVVISNMALEHVHNPIDTLRSLKRVVRSGGLIVFVVPHEKLRWRYRPGDVNQHIYTWSPMSLGNLLNTAGFVTQHVDVIRHVWPPYYGQIRKIFGRWIFDLACRIYAWIGGGKFVSLRVVAKNP